LNKIALILFVLGSVYPVFAQNCSNQSVRCVPQEYSTIQKAADAANPGDIVSVSNGSYAGFMIRQSGTRESPITFEAAGQSVLIDRPISGTGTKCDGDGICLKGSSQLQGVHDIVIEGFNIQDTYRCVSGYDSSPVTDSSSESPHVRITVRKNACSRAAHEGFYLNEFNSSLIEENLIHDSGSNRADRGHCIYLANAGSDDTTIRGNLLYNCGQSSGSAGIHFNGDASVGGDGVQTGLLIEMNVIHDTFQNALNMDGVRHVTIQNNLFYNVGRYSIDAYQGDASSGPYKFRVINNTFFAKEGSTKPALVFEEDGGGHVLFNNIRVQDGTAEGDPDSSHDLVATFESASSWFKNRSSGDYELNRNARPVNLGVASLWGIRAPGLDLNGGVRAGDGNYDSGAYEFGSRKRTDLSGDSSSGCGNSSKGFGGHFAGVSALLTALCIRRRLRVPRR
jgi:hypothetical protein